MSLKRTHVQMQIAPTAKNLHTIYETTLKQIRKVQTPLQVKMTTQSLHFLLVNHVDITVSTNTTCFNNSHLIIESNQRVHLPF